MKNTIQMQIRDKDDKIISEDILEIRKGDILIFEVTEDIPHSLLHNYIKSLRDAINNLNERNNPNQISGLMIPYGIKLKVLTFLQTEVEKDE